MIPGDKIQVTPTIDGIKRPPVMATVIYIHPQRRYFTAEYEIPGGGRVRESFSLRHRSGK